jgi:acid phosphatase
MKGAVLPVALLAGGVYAGATTEPAYTTTRPAISTISPSASAVASAAASATASSPVSDVKGVAFDRFIQIWLENQDYNVRRPATELEVC